MSEENKQVWDENYWSAREAAALEARMEDPRGQLHGLEKQLTDKAAFLRAFEAANFDVLRPHLEEMSKAADEIVVAANGPENMARAQGEARAFRYLLHLPEMLKTDCEELQRQLKDKRSELDDVQADAGLVPGRGR